MNSRNDLTKQDMEMISRLRNKPVLFAIWVWLTEQPSVHLTVSEVKEGMEKDGMSVSTASVYKVRREMIEAGIVPSFKDKVISYVRRVSAFNMA